MKHLLVFPLFVLVCVIFGSCRQATQYPIVLETADSLAYVNPDSAVSLLQDMESEMLASRPAVRHYYDLLTLKAQDKVDLPLTSDSLILDILEFYEHGGDPNILPEAYYYAGRVYRELGDAPQAIDYFQKAQTSLDELNLQKLPITKAEQYEKLKGTILAQKGYLLERQHLYKEALDSFKQAYMLDSVLHDTMGMFYCLKDAGGVFSAARDDEGAIRFFDLAEQLASGYSGKINLDNLITQKCHCLVRLKRFNEVEKILQSFQPQITRVNFEQIFTMYGEYYWKIGEIDKASQYFKTLYEKGSVFSRSNASLWLSDYETKRGNAKAAMSYMAEFSKLELEVRKLRDEEVVALSNSLYNYNLREQENLRLKTTQRIHNLTIMSLLTISFFLTCTLIALGQYIQIRQRRNNSREKQLCYLLNLMQADKEKYQHTIENEAANLRNTEIHQTIRNKCSKRQGLSREDWEEVEKALQSVAPNFITYLRSIYDFSEIEWRVSLLTKMGYSTSEIAIATNHSQQSIYTIRRRLFKKVFPDGSDFKDWIDFLNSI